MISVSFSVQFSCSVMSDFLQSHELQQNRLPCPSPTPRACSNSCPSSRWCHQPSYPLSSPSPPAFNLSQHQSLPMSQFFTSGGTDWRIPILQSFSFSISPSNVYLGLISFRRDWLDLLAVKEGLSRVFSSPASNTFKRYTGEKAM